MDEYHDMPDEIFKAIQKFADALDEVCRLRKKRKDRKKELVYHYAHARNGDRIVREEHEKGYKKEHERANYCCDKLQEEREEFYKVRDKLFQENLALKDENQALSLENEARLAQIKGMEQQIKELRAQIPPSDPQNAD